jgi:dTDP-4-dehydrorhamnose 3,5-epimerase
MRVIETEIPDVKIIEPKIFEDSRGYFFESFNEQEFIERICNCRFIQDNESKSLFGVLRGLHIQKPPFTQAKLVRVVQGEVLDVAVDLRKDSKTFGKYTSVKLSSENKKQFFVPRGFAHGFIVLSDEAIFSYKVDNIYNKESELGIIYNDNALDIDWELDENEIQLSEKDKKSFSFEQLDFFTEQEYFNS